jgi:hypothetical protein
MNEMARGQTRSALEKETLSICQFNFLPIQYIHPSWLITLPNSFILERLRHCQRTAHRLSRYLLTHFELDDQYWFAFTNPIHRIALLNSSSLIKLVFYTGLTLNADPIRRAVGRCEVVNLKKAIGEEGYLFAVKRAPFLWPTPKNVDTLPTDPYQLRQYLISKGITYLDNVFYQHSPALTQRLWWKLPMRWHCSLPPATLQPPKQDTIALLLCKLVKELELT